MKRHLWLMGIMVAALAAFLMVLAACAAEATPTPTPRPPTPTPTPRPPTPTPTPLPPGVTPIPPTPTPTPVPKTPEQIIYEEALEEFKAVEAAAKKEGLVFIYSVPWGEADQIENYKIFNKHYPEIKVDGLRTRGAATLERVRAETATGRRLADAFFPSGLSNSYIMHDEGHLLLWTPPAMLEPGVQWLFPPFPMGLGHPSNSPTGGSPSMWMINTRLVPEGQEPKCWTDLTDPKWKDKLTSADPTTPSPAQYFLYPLYKIKGEQFVLDLLRNVVIFQDNEETHRGVARGDYAIDLSANYVTFQKYKDAPIKPVAPCEGANYSLGGTNTIFKDAPHPNAAKVFANFWLTREGQQALEDTGASALRMDVVKQKPLVDPALLKPLYAEAYWTQEYGTTIIPALRAQWRAYLKSIGKM